MKKKTCILIKLSLMMGVLLIFTISCKKGDGSNTPPAVINQEPYLETSVVSEITTVSAVGGGIYHGDLDVNGVVEKGLCWITNVSPQIGNGVTGAGSLSNDGFVFHLTELIPDTKYYVRAYLKHPYSLPIYGNEVSFTTSKVLPITFNPLVKYGNMTDLDGNIYKTVIIGAQTWMAENLRTTKCKDGTPIPYVADANAWYNLYTPGYCWFNNLIIYKTSRGALYNWYTIDTGKLCPVGWHIPAVAEWKILIDYLGGEIVAQGKLKETGTSHWLSPNTNATNESGFTALPGAIRYYDGSYDYWYYIIDRGSWWSAGPGGGGGRYDSKGRAHDEMAGGLFLTNDNYNSGCSQGFTITRENGASVRCIKD
ncbi:MAG: fibrobacter succinogenes major paralogous domain-containing protein [Prolixibacteraceae bacterium]|nr:fibrobacter succinogenes major paralogous domain-containing protein [Prolixibacteraceae bacterium]